MNQTHSNKVLSVQSINNLERFNCDALLTSNDGIALCVLTADCAPILVYEAKKNSGMYTCWLERSIFRYY